MIFKSPLPDVEIPEVPLPRLVLEGAARHPDRPAMVDGLSGRALTFADLETGVDHLAGALAARGLRKGDVVAVFSPNLPDFPIAFHGVLAAGGVCTTINSLYTAREASLQLRDSGARFLIVAPPFMDRAQQAIADTAVEEVFAFGEAPGATPLAALLAEERPAPAVVLNPAEDLAALPYSSGTTGLAKGVMLTHRNLVANLVQTAVVQRAQESERVLGVLPFYHIYGMQVVMNLTLWRGATVVTMPRFELNDFLRVLQDHRITRAYLAPPLVLALAKSPEVEGYDLSHLKIVFSGAAPLDAGLAEACARRIGCSVSQGYGLTETSPVSHSIPEGWPALPGSVGVCLPKTETKVADLATGVDLGSNVDGEIWIRGPQVMKGYFHNPEATAFTLDSDGWLHTGDIGHADADGNFYIVDRLKELIKYKGYQVPPAELEAILLSHPAVADAAVVPYPDEEAGEIPKAYVVLREPAQPEEIMAFVAEKVAPYKRIRLLEVIDQVPKSASGKIFRRVLRDRDRPAAAG